MALLCTAISGYGVTAEELSTTNVPSAPLVWVLNSDATRDQYRTFLEALRTAAQLRPEQILISTLDAENASANEPRIPDVRFAVAVGTRAAVSLCTRNLAMPLLLSLIPKTTYDLSLEPMCGANTKPRTALFLDQPLERQVAALRLALPHYQRAAVILGPSTRLQKDAIAALLRKFNLEAEIVDVDDVNNVFYSLERLADRLTFLLAVPDPMVFNSKTAPHILLAAYRYGMPVVGYSENYVKAGALLAVHSSPEQLGQQAGELIARALKSPKLLLPTTQPPKYYSVSINHQVARSLGLSPLDEKDLLGQLKRKTEIGND